MALEASFTVIKGKIAPGQIVSIQAIVGASKTTFGPLTASVSSVERKRGKSSGRFLLLDDLKGLVGQYKVSSSDEHPFSIGHDGKGAITLKQMP